MSDIKNFVKTHNLFFYRWWDFRKNHHSISKKNLITRNQKIDALYNLISNLQGELLGYWYSKIEPEEIFSVNSDIKFKVERIKEFELVTEKQGTTSFLMVVSLSENSRMKKARLQVIGYCSVQLVNNAYPIRLYDDDHGTSLAENTSAHKEGRISARSLLGISRIWIAQEYRRIGMATKLVDYIRQNFVYGYRFSRKLCCYHQLTVDGRKFAENYAGGNEVLVFE